MKEKQIIFINSTVLYVITFLLTTIIHEFGHALIGLGTSTNSMDFR